MRGPVVLADGVRILNICVHPDEDAHFDQIVKRCVCVISRQTSYSVELLMVGQDICPLHRVLYLLGNSHYPIGRLPRPPARRGSQRHAATLSRPDSLSLIPCQPLRAAGCEASRWRTSSSLCHRLLDESGFPVPDTLTPNSRHGAPRPQPLAADAVPHIPRLRHHVGASSVRISSGMLSII